MQEVTNCVGLAGQSDRFADSLSDQVELRHLSLALRTVEDHVLEEVDFLNLLIGHLCVV